MGLEDKKLITMLEICREFLTVSYPARFFHVTGRGPCRMSYQPSVMITHRINTTVSQRQFQQSLTPVYSVTDK